MPTVAELIVSSAQAEGVDPRLALEVAIRESGLDQSAIGADGEIGVFQLMPSTAAGLGVDPHELQGNISGGIALLDNLLGDYGDPAKALAAYNWGPGDKDHPRLNYVLSVYGSDWFSHIPASTRVYIQDILGNVATQYSPPQFAPATLVAESVKGMDWKPVLYAIGVGLAVLIGTRLFSRAISD